MAKGKAKARSGNGAPKEVQVAKEAASSAPSGYQNHGTSDIVGFWKPEREDARGKVLPIHFIPLEIKLFDSKIDNKKTSAIVVGKLVDPCVLDAPGGEDEIVQGQAGDVVGVWYKPGMSDVKTLGGVKVWMVLTGELDTGKINPMKTFDVLSASKGKDLYVTQDFRKQSLNVETGFLGARGDAKANAARPPEQGTDDIPF